MSSGWLLSHSLYIKITGAVAKYMNLVKDSCLVSVLWEPLNWTIDKRSLAASIHKNNMISMYALYLYIIILEIASTKQKLLFSRSGGAVGVSSFRTMYKLPLDDCRIVCMARQSCASVNYFRSSQKCELNKMAGGVWNVGEKTGSVYSVKADWTDVSVNSLHTG